MDYVKAILSTLLICSQSLSYAWTNIALSFRSTSPSTSTSSLTAEFIDSASESEKSTKSTRRDFLVSALATATTIVLSNSQPSFADEEDLIDVYFGCGCFWHVQQ